MIALPFLLQVLSHSLPSSLLFYRVDCGTRSQMSSCLPDLDLYPVSSLFVTGRFYGHKLLGGFNILCVFFHFSGGKKKKSYFQIFVFYSEFCLWLAYATY